MNWTYNLYNDLEALISIAKNSWKDKDNNLPFSYIIDTSDVIARNNSIKINNTVSARGNKVKYNYTIIEKNLIIKCGDNNSDMYYFPYRSGENEPAGFVCVPRNENAIITTDYLSGCEIDIYDNISDTYRIYVHNRHINGKIQLNNEKLRQQTYSEIINDLTEKKDLTIKKSYSSDHSVIFLDKTRSRTIKKEDYDPAIFNDNYKKFIINGIKDSYVMERTPIILQKQDEIHFFAFPRKLTYFCNSQRIVTDFIPIENVYVYVKEGQNERLSWSPKVQELS